MSLSVLGVGDSVVGFRVSVLGSLGSVPGEELPFGGILLLMPDFSVGRSFEQLQNP